MTLMFWGVALAMVIVATLFLATPILRVKAGSPFLVAAVVILVPAIGFGIYNFVGTPDALTRGPNVENVARNRSASVSTGSGPQSPGSVASLIGGLRSRLDENPDDADGWLLLAQSYRHLGDNTAADAAYQKAKSLGKTDIRFESLDTAASATPRKINADVGARVRGQVSLAPQLADQIRPDDTVFIFAKESREHRMPVAAIRRPAAALPIDFELTNSQVMVAGTDLARYESLLVTARISRSGLATDSETGWEAWSAPLSPLDGDVVKLVITAGENLKANSDE